MSRPLPPNVRNLLLLFLAAAVVLIGGMFVYIKNSSEGSSGDLTKSSQEDMDSEREACENAKPLDASQVQLPALFQLVQAAIEKKDLARLEALAACDFMLINGISGKGGFNRPKTVLPLLLPELQGVAWSGPDFEEEDHALYEDANPGKTLDHQLMFQRDSEDKWFWMGFLSAREELVDKMLVGGYEIGDEDE